MGGDATAPNLTNTAPQGSTGAGPSQPITWLMESQMVLRTNNRFTVLGLDNKVLGRAHKLDDGSVLCTFLEPDVKKGKPYSVAKYGPEDWAMQEAVKGWKLQPSCLVVHRVKLNEEKTTVQVTLLHQIHSGYNMIVEVPFVLDWNQIVREKLVELAKRDGTETQIGNWSALSV